MVLPLIPVILFGVLASGTAGLTAYYRADARTRERWDLLVSAWLGLPVDDVAVLPKLERNEYARILDETSMEKYGKRFAELDDAEAARIIEHLSLQKPRRLGPKKPKRLGPKKPKQ